MKMDWMSDIKSTVLTRDGKCVSCGSVNDLRIRCVKEWHRRDPASWVCMCDKCRAKSHEESRKIDVSAKKPQKRTLARKVDELMNEVKVLRDELSRTKDRLRAYERNR